MALPELFRQIPPQPQNYYPPGKYLLPNIWGTPNSSRIISTCSAREVKRLNSLIRGGEAQVDTENINRTTTSDFKSKRRFINNPLKIKVRDNATKQFMRSRITLSCINNHQSRSTLASYFRMMRGLCLSRGKPLGRHID